MGFVTTNSGTLRNTVQSTYQAHYSVMPEVKVSPLPSGSVTITIGSWLDPETRLFFPSIEMALSFADTVMGTVLAAHDRDGVPFDAYDPDDVEVLESDGTIAHPAP